MRLIKPFTEIWEQEYIGQEGILKQVEKCARVCYKSEEHITEYSYKKLGRMLKEKGHLAMFEHGTVYLKVPYPIGTAPSTSWVLDSYLKNPYSRVFSTNGYFYITTNYRVLIENSWENDIEYICEPEEHHKKRITVKFTCDRGISHEIVRHRVFSFAQESTRYCNYSKDKFGNELTFIIPEWYSNIQEGQYEDVTLTSNSDGEIIGGIQNMKTGRIWNVLSSEGKFLNFILQNERLYFDLLHLKQTPQQARVVLPNALKTEVCMTGFIEDWEHFFKLRCDKTAHPQMRELAIPLEEEFKKLNYI